MNTGRLVTDCESSSIQNDKVEEKLRYNLGTLHELIQKLTKADELIGQGTAVIELGAKFGKLMTSVERVSATVDFIADVSKCVAGVSSTFHLVAHGAQGVPMYAEANLGRIVHCSHLFGAPTTFSTFLLYLHFSL